MGVKNCGTESIQPSRLENEGTWLYVVCGQVRVEEHLVKSTDILKDFENEDLPRILPVALPCVFIRCCSLFSLPVRPIQVLVADITSRLRKLIDDIAEDNWMYEAVDPGYSGRQPRR